MNEVKSTNLFIERFCGYKILCLGQEKAGTPLVSRRAVCMVIATRYRERQDAHGFFLFLFREARYILEGITLSDL